MIKLPMLQPNGPDIVTMTCPEAKVIITHNLITQLIIDLQFDPYNFIFIWNFIFLGAYCNNTSAKLSTRTHWYCEMSGSVKYRDVCV